jgi:hypothetical protein
MTNASRSQKLILTLFLASAAISMPAISEGAVVANPHALVDGASSCVSSDPNHLCLGVSMVSFTDNNVPTISQAEAIATIDRINLVWGQCNVGFQLENYSAVDPTTKDLSFNVSWKSGGDSVREAFASNSTFLVVAVGKLKQLFSSTLAVSWMPGQSDVYGTLVESAYAQNELTVGHELGHYQGLSHVSDETNLLNPFLGPDTRTLTSDQCALARSTDQSFWPKMLRN